MSKLGLKEWIAFPLAEPLYVTHAGRRPELLQELSNYRFLSILALLLPVNQEIGSYTYDACFLVGVGGFHPT